MQTVQLIIYEIKNGNWRVRLWPYHSDVDCNEKDLEWRLSSIIFAKVSSPQKDRGSIHTDPMILTGPVKLIKISSLKAETMCVLCFPGT